MSVDVDALLNDLRRVRPRRNARKNLSQKEKLKKQRGYRCDYCKQKKSDHQLSVALTNYHRVQEGETLESVAYDFNISQRDLKRMNSKIFKDRSWESGLMINVPEGKLNLFLNRNGVVSCRECMVKRNGLGLSHPEYVYHLLDKRQEEREAVTREFRQDVFKRDGYKCHYCELIGEETKGRLTLDHKIPIVNGGKTTMENSITSCYRHNLKKGAMPYGRFIDMLLKKQAKKS